MAQAVSYDDVARLLRNFEKPDWPAAHLKLLGSLLVKSRDDGANRPSRAELVRRLRQLESAAIEVQSALSSPPILAWLVCDGDEFRPEFWDVWANMVDLEQRAKSATLRVPKKGGRTRSTLPHEISARADRLAQQNGGCSYMIRPQPEPVGIRIRLALLAADVPNLYPRGGPRHGTTKGQCRVSRAAEAFRDRGGPRGQHRRSIDLQA
jgi:hypothetical protein